MLWSYAEYVPLRLLRRWIVPDSALHRLSGALPFTEPNLGISEPQAIVSAWENVLAGGRAGWAGRHVLELGPGHSNATGEALLNAGAAHWTGVEPFRAGKDLPKNPHLERVESLTDVADGSVDLVVSHSVLEHIAGPDILIPALARVLKPDGLMVHVVDYRDHFFKYPYHFLTFDAETWTRWLDPGDLPRWRLMDHQAWFEDAGFRVQVKSTARDAQAFERIRPYLKPPFDQEDDGVDVTRASLLVTGGV